jgi:hypothetical protein
MWIWVFIWLLNSLTCKKEYIDSKDSVHSLVIISADHSKSIHKYIDTELKLLYCKANVYFNKIIVEQICISYYAQRVVKLSICAWNGTNYYIINVLIILELTVHFVIWTHNGCNSIFYEFIYLSSDDDGPVRAEILHNCAVCKIISVAVNVEVSCLLFCWRLHKKEYTDRTEYIPWRLFMLRSIRKYVNTNSKLLICDVNLQSDPKSRSIFVNYFFWA